MSVCFFGIDSNILDSFLFIFLVIARLKLWLILMACFCHLASALINTDNILKVVARYPASTLTYTINKAEDLAVHCQAYIYKSDSILPITYLGLKAIRQVLNHSRTVPDVITVRFDPPV